MIVYILAFLLSEIGVSFYYKARESHPGKRHTAIFVLAGLPLALVSAVRWNVGTDFQNYRAHAETIFGGYNWRYDFEFGYDWLVEGVMTLTHNSQFVFAVTAFLTVYLIWGVISKNSVNPCISWAVFVLGTFYFSSMNLVRMYLAVPIVLMAYFFLMQGKRVKFILAVLLASCFHTSALIALILLVLFTKKGKNSAKLVFLYAALFLFVMVFHSKIFSLMQMVYPSYGLNRLDEEHQSWIRVAFELLILAVALLRYKYVTETHKRNYYFLLILGFTECLLLLCGNWFPYMSRASLYFQIGQIFLIPMIVNTFQSKDKSLVTIGVYAYYCLYVFYSIVMVGTYDVLPYQTFWGV